MCPPSSPVHRPLFRALALPLLWALLWASPAQARSVVPVAKKDPAANPLALSSKDGSTSISLGLGVQLQVDNDWKDTADGYDHGGQFRLRRLQPIIKGKLLSPRLSYKLMVEVIPGKFDFMDVWLDHKAHRWAQVRLGVQKVAFTRKRANSWKKQALVDFSSAPRYLGTERQVGIVVHNGVSKSPRHEYQVSLTTGITTRPGIGTGVARVSKEARTEPMLVTGDPSALNAFHPALHAHYAYNHGGIDNTRETDWRGSGLRFSLGVAGGYDFSPEVLRDFRSRLAVEGMLKWRGLTLFGDFTLGWFAARDELSSAQLGLYGGSLTASYLLWRTVELAARFSRVDTTRDLRLFSQQNAAAKIGAASPGSEEQAALSKQFKGAGTLVSDQELVFGVNVFPLGKNLKLATDFGLIWKESEGKDPPLDLRSRLLAQYYF